MHEAICVGPRDVAAGMHWWQEFESSHLAYCTAAAITLLALHSRPLSCPPIASPSSPALLSYARSPLFASHSAQTDKIFSQQAALSAAQDELRGLRQQLEAKEAQVGVGHALGGGGDFAGGN